jgi:formamidopyrimidine-DNA glycosylase
MPEGLEAEIYRRSAERVVGRTIAAVEVDDHQAMAAELTRSLPGRTVTAARRRGKHVLLDLDDREVAGGVVGLHFGMTGRLMVDGIAAIDELVYSSRRDDPAWNRLIVTFNDGTAIRVNDPRRWAVFTLDPDLGRIGPDFLELTVAVLAERFRGRRAAIKQVLLDQSVVAGFGNMCIDEVLWQAGVAPSASVARLGETQLDAVVQMSRVHLPAMLDRGGSHTGELDPDVRASCPPCPRDGAPLRRDTIGGRTTIWCPVHQTS